MITLHKLLPFLLSPIVIVLALVVGSLLRRRAWLAWAGIGLLMMASMPVVSHPLVRWVEGVDVARGNAQEMEKAQAVVVLGGMSHAVRAAIPAGTSGLAGTSGPGFVREWSGAADRFAGGVDLFRQGKAPLLVFTGGRLPWEVLPDTEGDWLRAQAIAQGVPASSILVTDLAENTAQEAQAVAKLLPGSRVILVTSAFHIPRARALFEARGLEVLPFPVDFQVPERAMTAMDWLPDAQALALTDMAWRELLGRAYYAVRGW